MKTPILVTLQKLFRLAGRVQESGHSIDQILEHKAQNHSSRRQFLKYSAQTAAILGTTGMSWKTALQTDKKIAIVGAGIGGLSAGWHLKEKGVTATIFEADKRAGGRIKTHHSFANNTLSTELGAEFIDTNHEDMLFWVEKLGFKDQLIDVSLDTFGQKEAVFINGRHYSEKEIITDLTAAYPKILKNRKKLDTRRGKKIDHWSMAEYIDKMPVSDWMKQLLDITYTAENGLDTSEQSAANLLSLLEIKNDAYLPYSDSDERFKLRGGNDQIPQALARRLSNQIRYEHRLLSLRENANQTITLTFSENGTTREENFDAVIMTIPFTILRDLDIKMDLPPLKKEVIKSLGYGTNAKFVFDVEQRFWRSKGYQGYLFNEVIQNGWDSSHMQNNNQGTGIYTCFMGGTAGRNMTKSEQGKYINAVSSAFPTSAINLTGTSEMAVWVNNPYSKASYSCMKPGQNTRFHGAAFEPVRRLYFAGEHCSSDYWGFMNGAAETGRRAAERVMVDL